jgi:hypothetical protein
MDTTTYLSNFHHNSDEEGGEAGDCFRSDEVDWAGLLWEVDELTAGTSIVNLTNSLDPHELIQVAENAFVSSRTLTALAFNESPEVRAAVADSRKTPLAALMMLAQDENDDVRFQLAENHNIPDSVLLLLIDDANPFVAWRAETTLERKQAEALRAAA